MEAIKQPWLTKNEVFEGKPKVVEMEISEEKVNFDRETGQTTLEKEGFKTKETELLLNILADFTNQQSRKCFFAI